MKLKIKKITKQSAEKTLKKVRGRPFQKGKSGNPAGKPKGCKNKLTLLAQNLMSDQSERLIKKTINLALEGDRTALKLCMERILPPVKDLPIALSIPDLNQEGVSKKLMEIILSQVANSELSPNQGQAVSSIVESYQRAIEVNNIEERVLALEEVERKNARN